MQFAHIRTGLVLTVVSETERDVTYQQDGCEVSIVPASLFHRYFKAVS